ncbi:MAG: homocysteine S-methyltransferase family protein [Lachnospiraceae bacterium]|jgi:5-methyltetrahydrofolate--homocysteine methyltransferase|nr:homocysteine S-methyltransferase family protein [Lachnospiraceae bacterium]
MTKQEFSALVKKGPVILDGATGSNLLKMGMPRGTATELWVEEHPEVIQKLQAAYLEAGSQILYAPTFLANRIGLQGHGILESDLSHKVKTLNHTLVGYTKEVAAGNVLTDARKALVAGDIGGTGSFMQPYGPLTYEELLECYKEQITCLAEAGVDLLVVETMISLEETMVVLDAAASVCELPVLASLTCEADGSLFFGGNIFDATSSLAEIGADAVGCNCSVGPDQLEAVVSTIASRVSVPVIAKPNAGMPVITETGEAVYSMGPEEFARHMKKLQDAGASLLGGCCGTGPEYIRAMVGVL